MAKIKVVGIDSFVRDLNDLAGDTEGICKMAVYEGAKVVADSVKANINALPTRDGKYVPKGKKARGATPEEKAALQSGFGISRMRANGTIDVSIGFDGYMAGGTKNYPKGKPISMIARSIESGTSWLQKTPFVNRGVASSKGAAEAAMQKCFDAEIKKRGI